MKVRWIGHAAFLLEGSKRVLIDPFITGNPTAAIKADEVCADLIAVTHGHGDHLGDAVEISKRCDAPVICIHELSRYLARKNVEAVGMNIGGTAEVKGLKVTMVHALHSADTEEDESLITMGSAAGVIIEIDGVRVYHTGDTDVFLDMQLIGELHSPDIMLLPIGDWYTMGMRGAVKAIEFVKPKVAIPMHYNTFPVIRQNPDDFKRVVNEKGLNVEIVILNPGEDFEYP
jgi:L-ascorbate metabolism protein UlaG (beta-lactamase superfamily)